MTFQDWKDYVKLKEKYRQVFKQYLTLIIVSILIVGTLGYEIVRLNTTIKKLENNVTTQEIKYIEIQTKLGRYEDLEKK